MERKLVMFAWYVAGIPSVGLVLLVLSDISGYDLIKCILVPSEALFVVGSYFLWRKNVR